MKAASFTLQVFLLAGCAVQGPYDVPGNKAQKDQQVTLSGFLGSPLPAKLLAPDKHWHSEQVLIACVDGKYMGNTFTGLSNGFEFPDQVIIDSGHHDIVAYYAVNVGTRTTFLNLSLETESGHQYIIRRRLVPEGIELYVADAVTGAIIAGPTPENHENSYPNSSHHVPPLKCGG